MPTDKPLVLAEEIAKIFRDNDPAAWLVDAEAALGELNNIASVKEQAFRIVRETVDGLHCLELRTRRGLIGRYEVANENYHGATHGVVFRPHPKFVESNSDFRREAEHFAAEQYFLRHLLSVVRLALSV
jgi:hypothetical protein